MAGVETVVRERYEESTEPRNKTEKKGERERPVDSIPRARRNNEKGYGERKREREGRRTRNRRKRGRTDGRKSRGLSVPLLRKVTND